MKSKEYKLQNQQEQHDLLLGMLQSLDRTTDVLTPDPTFTDEDKAYLWSQGIVL